MKYICDACGAELKKTDKYCTLCGAKVKKDIENVGGKIAGVVINKVPVNAAKYESSYYYGSTATSNTPRKKEPEREFYTNDSSRITKAKKEDILNQLDEFLKDK